MRLATDDIESLSSVNLYVKIYLDLEQVVGMRVRSTSSFLNQDSIFMLLTFNKLGFCLFGEVEILVESPQTMQAIMQGYGDCPCGLHRHVTNAK